MWQNFYTIKLNGNFFQILVDGDDASDDDDDDEVGMTFHLHTFSGGLTKKYQKKVF